MRHESRIFFFEYETRFQNTPRTIIEVYKNLPEGTLAEIIDDVIYMSPSPFYNHQEVLLEISSQLKQHLKEWGKIAIAPFDIYLNETSSVVQPDIVIILDSNKGTLNPNGHFHGVPGVIIEILSQGNRDYDLIKKKELCERFGVKEYWVVDPQSKTALGYFLEYAQYASLGMAQNSTPFRLLSSYYRMLTRWHYNFEPQTWNLKLYAPLPGCCMDLIFYL